MRDEKLYTVSWTQVYESWPVDPEVKSESETDEVLDLTEAREVLARIMAK